MIPDYKQSCRKIKIEFGKTRFFDIAKLPCPFCDGAWSKMSAKATRLYCPKCGYVLHFTPEERLLYQVNYKHLYACYDARIQIYGHFGHLPIKEYRETPWQLNNLLNTMTLLANLQFLR